MSEKNNTYWFKFTLITFAVVVAVMGLLFIAIPSQPSATPPVFEDTVTTMNQADLDDDDFYQLVHEWWYQLSDSSRAEGCGEYKISQDKAYMDYMRGIEDSPFTWEQAETMWGHLVNNIFENDAAWACGTLAS